MTTGNKVGSSIGAAEGDGDDVVEGPFAQVQRAATIKTAVCVAGENAGAKSLVAEMVGTRPGAGLAGGVEWDGKAVGERGELRRSARASEALQDFAGQTDGDKAAAGAAVEEAHAIFARQEAKIVPRGIGGKAQSRGQLAS